MALDTSLINDSYCALLSNYYGLLSRALSLVLHHSLPTQMRIDHKPVNQRISKDSENLTQIILAAYPLLSSPFSWWSTIGNCSMRCINMIRVKVDIRLVRLFERRASGTPNNGMTSSVSNLTSLTAFWPGTCIATKCQLIIKSLKAIVWWFPKSQSWVTPWHPHPKFENDAELKYGKEVAG